MIIRALYSDGGRIVDALYIPNGQSFNLTENWVDISMFDFDTWAKKRVREENTLRSLPNVVQYIIEQKRRWLAHSLRRYSGTLPEQWVLDFEELVNDARSSL